ncbi:MAG: hypothetical protein ACR2MG_09330 [Pyrinomonadaceae bacterium]
MKTMLVSLIVLLTMALGTFAQTDNKTNFTPSPDSLQNISQEITKISKSVQNFNNNIKELLEKFMVGKGFQLTDRQQKLLLGYEVLNRAEQRLEILQKYQIELTQKEGEVKTRMAQVEEASFPDSIDRSVAIIGTTRGEEMRENRRQTLENERRSLQNLLAQIRRNLQQTNDELRQAENFVNSLRKKILPQIEAELSDL